jgi:hypothetical protein
VGVTFEVEGRKYEIADPQATILAENLRVLSQSELVAPSEPAVRLMPDKGWREGAQSLADSIEAALVEDRTEPLHLEGGAADATYCVLRLMVGLDNEGAAAAGLRDALGTPVPTEPAPPRLPRTGHAIRQLSKPEMWELVIILFVLAVLTVVLGFAWTSTWWVLAPVIAARIGLRVATTRTSGRFAWSVGSVIMFAVLLVPAAVLVALVGLLLAAILNV